MRRCPERAGCRHLRLGDSRVKRPTGGRRFCWMPVWDSGALGHGLEPGATGAVLPGRAVVPVAGPLQRPNLSGATTSNGSCRPAVRFDRGSCVGHPKRLSSLTETTFGGARKSTCGWGASRQGGCVRAWLSTRVIAKGDADPRTRFQCRSWMRPEAHTRKDALHYAKEWRAHVTLKLYGEHGMIRKEKLGLSGGTTRTASKVSGAMPSIGYTWGLACSSPILPSLPSRGLLPVRAPAPEPETLAVSALRANVHPGATLHSGPERLGITPRKSPFRF
jgi:hypothetical protein